MHQDPLRSSELFKHLDDEQFSQIAPRLKFYEADKNDILYAEGAPADTVAIVIEGELQAMKTSKIHHGKTVLCEFGPSDIIGEMALLSDPERSATVRVLEHTKLATFSRADFGVMKRQRPDIALSMLEGVVRILAQRLQDTSADLADQR